ncbi:hypothetical protein DZC76_14800 [Pseudomonas sp. phDV1]|nr:hypothetical protein DZC76_14800 [Pseudomonas sp. phDV1]
MSAIHPICRNDRQQAGSYTGTRPADFLGSRIRGRFRSPQTHIGNFPIRDRVGGGLTAAVLPHHRAYGSVHGGSGHAVKPIDRIQYRDQSKSVP